MEGGSGRDENTEEDGGWSVPRFPRDHHQGNWIRHFSNPAPLPPPPKNTAFGLCLVGNVFSSLREREVSALQSN